MNKEKWIEEVSNSLDGLKPAAAHPFLFNKILSKLESVKKEYVPARIALLTTAAFMLLLVLNYLVLKQSAHSKEISGMKEISESLLNTSTINYN